MLFRSSHYRRRLVFGFAACDLLASLAAASMRIEVPAAAVAFALAIGLAILVGAKKMPALYLLVPVLLCVDNLAVATPPASALLAGTFSGIAACAGFLAGQHALRAIPRPAASLVGAAALAVSLVA